MTLIAPSLLSADFLNLEKDIKRFDGIDNLWLHLDIMDGHFVPNLTLGTPVLKNISKISPHKLDAHLMVKNPEDYIEPLSQIGVHNYTFHWEAVTHHDRLIQLAKEKFDSVGISLNPSTKVEEIPKYILAKLDIVLIMTVNPGFGGQSFIEGCVDKIKKLDQMRKENNYHFQIQVDGGVKNTNSKMLIESGANNLVAGSYIFSDPKKDYKKQIQTLRS